MYEEIRQMQPDAEFYTREHCYINELSNGTNDPDVSIALAKVRPAVTTRWHRLHGITERYVILEGNGLVEVGNLPAHEVKYGDVVLIPPETPQRITNNGVTDLIFLAICSPRFYQDAYEDIEEAKFTEQSKRLNSID
ncbi:MAG: cupin domain-containing protein [Methylococcaceae bacterium]|nr:cupin domain-containing protein [Methylococcaceae bacterium]